MLLEESDVYKKGKNNNKSIFPSPSIDPSKI